MLSWWEGLFRDYRTLHTLSNCSFPPHLISGKYDRIWGRKPRLLLSWVKSLCEVWRAEDGNHIVNCYKWGFDNIGVTNGQFKGNWESLGDNRGNLGYWCYLWGLLSYVCVRCASQRRETIAPPILSLDIFRYLSVPILAVIHSQVPRILQLQREKNICIGGNEY